MRRAPPTTRPVACHSVAVVPRRAYHHTPTPRQHEQRSATATSSHGRERVVVLGSGWAGFRLAKSLDKKAYDVTVVSPRNHFLFTPLLPETTVGTLEFRTIMEPVRSVPNITFYQSAAKAIDTQKRVITCDGAYASNPTSDHVQQAFELPYDRLIVAVGAHNQTFGIPGVAENAYFLKEVDQARRIRLKILECFERASEPYSTVEDRRKLLTFVVVGGGATGIEFAAELSDFITEDIKRRYPQEVWSQARLILLEAGKSILSAFDQSLVGYATSQLKRRAVDLRFEAKVKHVHPNEIEMADGSRIPFGVCVWSTGVAPRPLVRSLPWEKAKDGRILVDPYLRVMHQSGVYALGDCGYIAERPLPCTAQAADQQAKYLAKALNEESQNRQPKPFVYVHRGMLAYVGSYKAISDLPHHKWRGIFAWLFWRSAYLTTLVSWSNRVLVPMHWFKSFLFGRDVSYF